MNRSASSIVFASLLAAAGSVCAAAPASAELVDARVHQQDGQGTLWLAFDTQPGGLEMDSSLNTQRLLVTGVSSADRRIEIAVPSAISVIELTQTGEDSVEIILSGMFETVQAEIRQGGIAILYQGDPVPGPVVTRRSAQPRPAEPQPESSDEPDSVPANPSAAVPAPRESNSGEADQARPGPADLMQSGQTDTVICGETEAAVAESPWDLDALASHADCLAEAGLTAQAVGLYERVLAFEPGHFSAAMGLGQIRRSNGSNEVARQLFLDAADNARTDSEALQARSAARGLEEG
jgi:hypothetical protein